MLWKSRKPKHLTIPTEYGQVVLDESRGRYWHLNDSAAIVSRCIRNGGSRDDAATELVTTFGIDPDLARRDVDAAHGQLRKVGLL